MNSVKMKKIGSQISRELSDVMASVAKDSLLKTITITGCEVNNDLSLAKVYFTSLSDLSSEQLEKELDEAAGYLRRELAERIDIRHTPELQFIYDKSVEYGQNIEKIISNLNSNKESN